MSSQTLNIPPDSPCPHLFLHPTLPTSSSPSPHSSLPSSPSLSPLSAMCSGHTQGSGLQAQGLWSIFLETSRTSFYSSSRLPQGMSLLSPLRQQSGPCLSLCPHPSGHLGAPATFGFCLRVLSVFSSWGLRLFCLKLYTQPLGQ